MKVVETIEKRKSVRTYVPTELSSQTLIPLRKIASELKGPFETPFHFELFKAQSKLMDTNEGLKLGTYGVIRGANHYIAGIVEQGEHDLEQLGYVMEHLILHATDMNLGTCWLGGTFSKKTLGIQLRLKENELMPAITPVGYKADNESLLSMAMKWSAKSAIRKDWSELFFNDVSLNPFNQLETGAYDLALEMVRLAPSASNKQPWRIVKDGRNFHFFMQENKMTTKVMGFPLQRVDMGIAMCHFELSTRELQLEGKWKVLEPIPFLTRQPSWQYIVSWQY
jgi:hypothetical protein